MSWYLENNNGEPPIIQCEDKHPIRKSIVYWLEPPIPGIENYRLVEYPIGDGYAFEIEVLPK